MNDVIQLDNCLSVTERARQTAYTFISFSAATTQFAWHTVPQTRPPVHPCVIVMSFPPDGLTYHCEDLMDIDDIVAKYTATDQDKAELIQAEKELHEELYQEVLKGNLNKVKYHRLIRNMDQQTLSKLSGIKQPNLSRIERYGYEADADTYKKIAAVFEIDYKELLQ
jgi:hypothetical protein